MPVNFNTQKCAAPGRRTIRSRNAAPMTHGEASQVCPINAMKNKSGATTRSLRDFSQLL